MTLDRLRRTMALAHALLALALVGATFAVPALAQNITIDRPARPRVKTPKPAKAPRVKAANAAADSARAARDLARAVPDSTAAPAPRVKQAKSPKHAAKPAAVAPREAPKPAATRSVEAPVQPAKPGALPRTLAELRLQKSDEVIARDLGAIDGWQAKVAALPGAADDVWRAAAAKAWLDAARVEYTDNDRQGFPQAAFERAVALASEIEAGKAPVDSSNAPAAVIPRGAAKVADSLYARLATLKQNPGFRCAREPIAQMEVELAWAGNEQLDQGDCRTSPHLRRAAELARAAQELCERCLPPVAAAIEEPPVPVPVDTMRVIPVEVPTKEEMRIPRNVHYALNQFDISPTSRSVIEGIVALLKKYPGVTARLVGHTDSRGSAEYNLELSKRRVNAARAVFVELGVDSARIATDYRGKSDTYAIEDSKRGFALNRRVEMVFVDPQGHDIAGERQEGDLQLEGEHSSKPQFSVPKQGTAPVKAPLKPKSPASGAAKKRASAGVRPATRPAAKPVASPVSKPPASGR